LDERRLHFDRCWPWLEAALKVAGNTHGKEDLWAGIERGEYAFWPGHRSAIVTEFYTSPRAKVVNFWLCGGDLKELLVMWPHIEAWAKDNGCVAAIGAGRAAWGRVMRRFGYRPVHTTFEREL
jgi:hypothetical protein